jgi:hypothetical protein
MTGTALADPASDKACTLKAASMLPRIAGMEMPPPAGWTTEPPIRVEVDFVAAGQKDTWAYLCAMANGTALVQRLAN